MSKEYRASFLGKQAELLLEEPAVIGGQTYMIGHTKEYVKGAVPIKEGEAAGLKNTLLYRHAEKFSDRRDHFPCRKQKIRVE